MRNCIGNIRKVGLYSDMHIRVYVLLREYYDSQLHIDGCVLELVGSYKVVGMVERELQRDPGVGVGGEER